MIRFCNLELQDASLWAKLNIDFSVDPDRPLTFIRGENESGKTSLLRMLTWALFGYEVVPPLSDDDAFTDPIRRHGATGTSTAKVWLTLEEVDAAGTVKKRWRIQRTLATIERDGQVERRPETSDLQQWTAAKWQSVPDGLKKLSNTYFRDEMKDFYLIDADKVDQYVGGPEGSHDNTLMQTTTTEAMRRLLGITTMLGVIERLERAAAELRREAGLKNDDAAYQQLAAAEVDARDRITEANKAIDELNPKLNEASTKIATLEEKQRIEWAENATYRALTTKIEKVGAHRERIIGELNEKRGRASTILHDPAVYKALAAPALRALDSQFDDLKTEGVLPRSEVELLPRLLSRGQCVCGEILDKDGDVHERKRHTTIAHLLTASREHHAEASALQRIMFAVRPLVADADGFGDGSAWVDDIDSVLSGCDELAETLVDLTATLDELLEERDALPELSDDYSAELRLHTRTATELRQKLESHQEDLTEAKSDHQSASKKLKAHESSKNRAKKELNAVRVAEDMVAAMREALNTIETERVRDVSSTMNTSFTEIADDRDDGTTGSMTSEVGVRLNDDDVYVIYAKNRDGTGKPLSILNGANRRATAVAFVLALARVSDQAPPIVADSLFHATSGHVRKKLLDHVLATPGQPILFGTRSDVRDQEANLSSAILDKVGKSYTFTSVHAGRLVNDVAAMLESDSTVAVCTCDVAHVCPACARRGDAKSDYVHHDAPQLLN